MGILATWVAEVRLSDPAQGAPRYDRERAFMEEALTEHGLIHAQVRGGELVLLFAVEAPSTCDDIIQICSNLLGPRSPRSTRWERLTPAISAA